MRYIYEATANINIYVATISPTRSVLNIDKYIEFQQVYKYVLDTFRYYVGTYTLIKRKLKRMRTVN